MSNIYSSLDCQSLLETHDSVASQACDSPPPSPCDYDDNEPEEDNKQNLQPPPDAIRMVGIRKVAGEHLVGHILNINTVGTTGFRVGLHFSALRSLNVCSKICYSSISTL